MGSQNDLPLVESGIQQAQTLSSALQKQNIAPTAIYCSPLQRTQQFSKILNTINPIVEPCLNEIDYGDWSGLNDEEIIAKFGKQALSAWNRQSIWPEDANWQPDETTLRKQIKTFTNNLKNNYADDNIFIISSNGVLRYFLTLIPDEFEKRIEQQNFKMKTGNISKLTLNQNALSVDFWNTTLCEG